MDKNRLTKQIFDYLWKKKKATTTWIKEVRKDLEKSNITESQMLERSEFRRAVKNLEGFQDAGRPKRSGRTWTEDQRKQTSDRMKEYWRQRKLQAKKKK